MSTSPNSSSALASVHLRPGFVQPIWAGHPWVFAQAIARTSGDPRPGDEVRVVDPEGKCLGRGFWSPDSAIPVRLLTRDGGVALDDAFLAGRVEEAAKWRRALLGLPSAESTGYRLVNADGDGLPGLTVDVFGDAASVQFGTAGMKRRQDVILDAVARAAGVSRVYEVASERHQQREGFTVTEGIVRGEGAAALSFVESGVRFAVAAPGSAGGGQKTGYYFDQRDNRAAVAAMAEGARVLDAFSYVGGFGLAAAKRGAREVVCVDSSASALTAGQRIADENGLGERVFFRREDVRDALGEMNRAGERFDVVVIDPPKLAHSAREVEKAMGQYRRLNAGAAGLVREGGVLVTCSCSGSVSADTFLRAVALGARDAGRQAQVLALHGAAPDHPSLAASPEGRYLKCVIARLP
ncbi:MAG: class I SAM-dependent rRNA methyltransferase [Polyangiales bacterium]